MGADQDLLFGRIALKWNYCTQAQLDHCLKLQAASKDRLPLGQILRREGCITEEQHSEILAIQRNNLSTVDPVSKAPKEATLLGRLAIREKMMSEKDVNLCLRLQAQPGEKRTIGEIMVEQGYLTPPQLKTLLGKQLKRIMHCPKCRLSFTVLSMTRAKHVSCPKCKGPLGEGKPTDSVRTDADLGTSVSNQIRKEEAKKSRSPESASSVRMVKMACPMCAKLFCEPVDSKGRVDCPFCLSSFSA